MKLYTIQLAKWRKAGEGLFDITLKSGDKRFSPNSELFKKAKYGNLPWGDYVTEYYKLMRESYRHHKEFWDDLVKRDRLVLACYCKPHTNCHRYLLVDILCKISEDVEYCGEIE